MEAKAVWRIDPICFDPELVETCVGIVRSAAGRPEPLTSGALHDAAQVAQVMPAAMVFVPSRAGLSHAREEDTGERELDLGLRIFSQFADVLLRSRSE